MASVAAGRGSRGLHPRLLPRQGGGLELGDFLPGGGRLGGRGERRPRLHSRGISLVFVVPSWALFSRVTCLMGWALWSSKVLPYGLSGALLWSSSLWQCQVTQIYNQLFWPLPWRR